jgi:GNAT superfamily N-acetyltransferase
VVAQGWQLPGFNLRQGRSAEKYLLEKFLTLTYRELNPVGDFYHLQSTVRQFLTPGTPFWFVDPIPSLDDLALDEPVGCLWLGSAMDQLHGDSHTHVLLLYVGTEYRRRGIGRALMIWAEAWAKQRGDGQLSLQVFQQSRAASALYAQLGYQPQSLWLVKSLNVD